DGKRALITGGASGIGIETLRRFSEEGARVAITARTADAFEPVRAEFGDRVLCIVSDAGDAANQKQVAASVKERFGELDVLFVNAGIADLKPVEQWTEAAWDGSFHTNVRGPFFLIQALLPVFANPAAILLNASINAHIGMPNTSVYGASKAALLSLSRTVSGELISRGIRVNAISPGPIATPLYSKLGLSAEDLKAVSEALRNQVPARRFGKASEIANAAVYLASDESAFMVGGELIVDGGLRL
ncbi:MAG TPA: SDR family oxidoreductase, partial [Bryobacteraceae bacterium]|nr:SDR family oxidoreductase [Bryobacteraceae bacterium]